MGAMHSLFKGGFFLWAGIATYGWYDPAWSVNFNWWYNWQFLEPNPEVWERLEENNRRYMYDRLIHARDHIQQGGESRIHKYWFGTDFEGDYWGSALPEFDEVVDQIYRTEARQQRAKLFSDKLRGIAEYPLPEFTGKKELQPNRIWSKTDETWKPKHFCLANMLWETEGFVDHFEDVLEENKRFEAAIAQKYKDPKLRELYWDFRRESQEHLAWDLYDLLPFLACKNDKQAKLSKFLQNGHNTSFINRCLKYENGAHKIFDAAGVVPFGESANASLLAKYDPTHGPYNEKLFY